MSPAPDVEVAVIGAGMAGLAAAAELVVRGHDVAVLEAGDRIGGVAQSDRCRGYVVERGPHTFRIPGVLLPFLRRHDVLGALEPAAPASRKRFLFRGGGLRAVPDGVWALARTPLLSARGKLRVLAEPFVARSAGRDESVSEFIRRRFGPELCEAFVGPFLTGVYAGDEAELGAAAVFPGLVDAEARRGSVALGLLLGPRPPRGLPGSWSGREGAETLPKRLGRGLGGRVRCGFRCVGIAPTPGGVQIDLEAHADLCARSVVVAIPAPNAARVLRRGFPEVAECLEHMEYAPVVNLSLGIPADATRRRVEGFGFLVPRGEMESLLGCLYPSQLFSGRAPAGFELLTAFAGGRRRPELIDADDSTLARVLEADLDRALGFRQDPLRLAITRWPQAIPQPGRRHRAIREALDTRMAHHPSLALAGGYLDGVAVADALLSGERTAARLSEWLRATPLGDTHGG